mmetsp:Transcript_25497/g.41440  ORF Transcript_25497/g.41440 Transcript_25497/m.41440 type:complete len:276 (-) Transcript_25497:393-1220(-)
MTKIQQGGDLEAKLGARTEFNCTMMNLICPFIIIAALNFLPFAHVRYLVQKLEPNNFNGSIEVGTEELPLDLHLFRCLGGICGEPKMMVNAKMIDILNAGNSAKTSPAPIEEENSIIVMLNSLSQVLATIFGDDDNMRDKLQIRVFAYAGVIVILLLLIASTLALISFVILVVSHLCKQSTAPQNVVAFLRETISSLLLCATVVYPAATWNQLRSSGSSLGSGYIVMVMLTVMIHSGSLIPKGLRAMGECIRRKQGKSRPSEIPPPVSQEANMII